MLTENYIAYRPALYQAEPHKLLRKKAGNFWKFIANLFTRVIVFFKGVDFIELDEEGKPQPSKMRLDKMEREMVELAEAEQYVLVAQKNGTYPCHSCPDSDTIYLKAGQVWKYGVTTKGEVGRYKYSLREQSLTYVPQLKGTIYDCLRHEKRKIYFYPVHPENLARAIPLLRPPGNKQDN